MAYVITDLNDFEITIDDGFRTITIWKQNIRFGDIVGDVITLYWHNKAQTDTEYKLAIDYNDVTTPVVASAAAVQTAIEGMITSGWVAAGGGGDVTGPGSATDNNIVLFNGATGKVIKDSGVLISSLITQDKFMMEVIPHPQFSPNDSQNYFAASPTIGPGLVEANTSYRFRFPRACVITDVTYHTYIVTLVGSAETATIYWRNSTDGTDALISNTVAYNALQNYNITNGLAITVLTTKNYMLKMAMPAFATNPQGVNGKLTLAGYFT